MGTGRAAHRAYYAAYIRSGRWQVRRRHWASHEEYLRGGAPIRCAVCDRVWTLDDDLHHASYDRLGHETHGDLVPLCRRCHEDLHQALDNSPGWRRMRHEVATTGIIAALRARRR